MVKIYFSKITDEWSPTKYDKYVSMLPKEMTSKIQNYKAWQDRQMRIAGKMLLSQLLQDFDQQITLENIRYTTFHKPFFDNDFSFSIAHSANIVVCVATINDKIGVDIEKRIPIDVEDFRDQLTAREWEFIQSSADSITAFYQIWTKKEALMKAMGKGIDIDFDRIEVVGDTFYHNGILYSTVAIDIDRDFTGHIAVSTPNISIELKKVVFSA